MERWSIPHASPCSSGWRQQREGHDDHRDAVEKTSSLGRLRRLYHRDRHVGSSRMGRGLDAFRVLAGRGCVGARCGKTGASSAAKPPGLAHRDDGCHKSKAACPPSVGHHHALERRRTHAVRSVQRHEQDESKRHHPFGRHTGPSFPHETLSGPSLAAPAWSLPRGPVVGRTTHRPSAAPGALDVGRGLASRGARVLRYATSNAGVARHSSG
jgi:hypothetical protein